MMMPYWQVHCDQVDANNISCRGGDKNAFCVYTNWKCYFFNFRNHPVFCYFYVMSCSTFSYHIRHRPFVECLNCAAWSISLYLTPIFLLNILKYRRMLTIQCIPFSRRRTFVWSEKKTQVLNLYQGMWCCQSTNVSLVIDCLMPFY